LKSRANCLDDLAQELFDAAISGTASSEELDLAIMLWEHKAESLHERDPLRKLVQSVIGTLCVSRYRRTQSMEDLDRSISILHSALDDVSLYDPSITPAFLRGYCQALSLRIARTDTLEDLDHVIEAREKFLNISDPDDEHRSIQTYHLCLELVFRYDKTREARDLDKAAALLIAGSDTSRSENLMLTMRIVDEFENLYNRENLPEYLDRAAELYREIQLHMPSDHPKLGQVYEKFSNTLLRRYQWTNSKADLDAATSFAQTAFDLSIPDSDERLQRIELLHRALEHTSEETASPETLDKIIKLNQLAIEEYPDDLFLPLWFRRAAWALLERFDITNAAEDLDRAFSFCEMALQIDPNDEYLVRAMVKALFYRFEETNSMEDLNEAIRLCESVTSSETITDSYPLLSQLLHHRFQRTDSMDDLDRSQSLCKEALKRTSTDVLRANCLSILSSVLMSRFERTGELLDINSSIDSLHEVLALRPQIGVITPGLTPPQDRNHLARAYRLKFSRFKDMQDLNKGITLADKALQGVPPRSRKLRFSCLQESALLFMVRSYESGSVSDLNQAVELFHQAIDLVPENHVDMPVLLNNLANCLVGRYQSTGVQEDLIRATTVGRRAVKLADSETYPAIRQFALCNLAVSYMNLGSRGQSIDYINLAIETHEECLRLLSQDHPDRPSRLNSLGVALMTKFSLSNSVSDLDRAIMLFQDASRSDHVRAGYNWAEALRMRFDETHDITDLEQAIMLLEHNPNTSSSMKTLGDLYTARLNYGKEEIDRRRALDAYATVFNDSSASTGLRANAALSAASLTEKNVVEASKLYKLAVEFIQTITPRVQRWSEQQYRLTGVNGLSSHAASVMIQAEYGAYDIIRTLEVGRGVLANSIFEIRSDITALEEAHPKIARRFVELQGALESFEADRHQSHVSDDFANRVQMRHVISDEFDSLLTRIRKLPGFENFMLAPTQEEVSLLAENGPIVFLNAAEPRCDAIVITTNEIKIVPFPKMQLAELKEKAISMEMAMKNLTIDTYASVQKEMKDLLEWVWDVAIEPLMETLGYTSTPIDGSWPHIWWIPIGAWTLIPVHAAGYHGVESNRNCLDRVISSYVPTLKSLAYARGRLTKLLSGKGGTKVTFVMMSQTPEQPSLQYVAEEVAVVDSLIPVHISRVTLQEPQKTDVLGQLPDAGIVHFACHGSSNLSNPSHSCLLLQDWQNNPLKVSDIAALKLKHAEFAYLSACETTTSRSSQLLDEAIHLTGACQLAGFPSVIGSLWSVDDKYSVQVAGTVYNTLCEGSELLDTRRAAEGLHAAIRQLKNQIQRPRMPHCSLIWAPYVHYGA